MNNKECLLSLRDASDKEISKLRECDTVRLHFKLSTMQHTTYRRRQQTKCLI